MLSMSQIIYYVQVTISLWSHDAYVTRGSLSPQNLVVIYKDYYSRPMLLILKPAHERNHGKNGYSIQRLVKDNYGSHRYFG